MKSVNVRACRVALVAAVAMLGAACASPLCVPGHFDCQGNDLMICNAKGEAYDFKEVCDLECSHGECVQPTCHSGNTRCGADRKTVEACVPKGSGWAVVEACEFGCNEGLCASTGTPICTANTKRCNGDALEECSPGGNLWAFLQYCATGCDANDSACKMPVCGPLSGRCNPATGAHEQCDATGLSWKAAACSAGESCLTGECVPVACKAHETRCLDTATAGTCNAGLTGFDPTPCAADQFCLSGACTKIVCAPFSTQCVGTTKLDVCNAGGTGYAEILCASGAKCAAGSCVPDNGATCTAGSKRCVDAITIGTCRTAGDGYDNGFCATGSVCQGQACVPIICTTGSTRCKGPATAQVCDPSGTSFVDVACGATQACDPGTNRCEAVVCTAGSTSCADAASVSTCNALGTGYARSSCGTGNVCSAGVCKPVTCVPGTTSCVDATRESICSSDGTGTSSITCASATACDTGRGVCASVICTPASARCADAGTVAACNATGTSYAYVGCKSSEACFGGACAPVSCTPNAATCADATHASVCNPAGTAAAVIDCAKSAQVCVNGSCTAPPASIVCVPGSFHCNGADVEECKPDGTAYAYVQSCTTSCAYGACTGTGCSPFNLTVAQASLPADNNSTTLVSSDVIADSRGNVVPDGTLFTVSASNNLGGVQAADADPGTVGVQVASVNGKIDFVFKTGPGAVAGQSGTVGATTLQASKCAGAATVSLVTAGTTGTVAEDFTRSTNRDAAATTAFWDTARGQGISALASGLGNGADGDLYVRGGNTFNINTSSNPANVSRTFPDAVSFSVASFSASDTAVVNGYPGGIAAGDEVILLNMMGDKTNNANVGHWEIFTVRAVDISTNSITFITPMTKVYGATSDNTTLTNQKIQLQRVPHYGNVTVSGTLTANAFSTTTGTGGLLFVKSNGAIVVAGGIVDMAQRGYPGVGGATDGWGPGGQGGLGAGLAGYNACDCRYDLQGGSAGYATAGSGTAGCGGSPNGRHGLAYGDVNLASIFMGASGGGGGCGNPVYAGGGIVMLWGLTLGVTGTVTTDGGSASSYTGASAGGSVFLRATQVNIGVGSVTARAGTAPYSGLGGAGRIRIDATTIHSGDTTVPTYTASGGLGAGGVRLQTIALDNTSGTITKARIVSVVDDSRGGSILYELSANGGGSWKTFVAGDPLQSFATAASDLRLRATLTPDGSNKPLGVQGVALEYLAP